MAISRSPAAFHAGTIRWAIDKLKQDYFAKDPDHIIDIWLFKDKKSYQEHTKRIFNDTPTTPTRRSC